MQSNRSTQAYSDVYHVCTYEVLAYTSTQRMLSTRIICLTSGESPPYATREDHVLVADPVVLYQVGIAV